MTRASLIAVLVALLLTVTGCVASHERATAAASGHATRISAAGRSDHSAGRPQAPVASVANSGGVTSVETRVGRNRFQLWVSTTGGRTWLKAAAPRQVLDDGGSPNFVDRRHGWLSGYRGNGRWELYRTTDGGRTWHAVTLPRSGAWLPGSFNFFGAEHAYFFAGTSRQGTTVTTLFSTGDGGVTWKRVWGPSRTAYGGGLFVDPRHALFGDLNGDMPYDVGAFSLYRTSDAGRSRTPVMLGGTPVKFGGTRRYPGVVGGWASVGGTFVIAAWRQDRRNLAHGRNLVYTSSDGGVHWRAHSAPSQAWLVGTGQDAKVLPALLSVASPTAWVTTDETRRHLFETTDAGKTWRVTRVPRSFKFAPEIDFTPAGVGWAVTTSGQLLRTTDGGRRWKQVTRPLRRKIGLDG